MRRAPSLIATMPSTWLLGVLCSQANHAAYALQLETMGMFKEVPCPPSFRAAPPLTGLAPPTPSLASPRPPLHGFLALDSRERRPKAPRQASPGRERGALATPIERAAMASDSACGYPPYTVATHGRAHARTTFLRVTPS